MNLFPEKVTCSSAGGWDFCEDTIQTITHRGGRQAQDRFSKKKKKKPDPLTSPWKGELASEAERWLQHSEGALLMEAGPAYCCRQVPSEGHLHAPARLSHRGVLPHWGPPCPTPMASSAWWLLPPLSIFPVHPSLQGPWVGRPHEPPQSPRWFLWAGLGLSLIFSIMEEISFLCGLALGKLSSPLQPQALLCLLFV